MKEAEKNILISPFKFGFKFEFAFAVHTIIIKMPFSFVQNRFSDIRNSEFWDNSMEIILIIIAPNGETIEVIILNSLLFILSLP